MTHGYRLLLKPWLLGYVSTRHDSALPEWEGRGLGRIRF
jgi:hypothetical protein